MHYFQQILVDLSIRSTVKGAQKAYYSSSHRDTLLGVKESLTHYGVELVAVRVENRDLSLLTFPAIVVENGTICVIHQLPPSNYWLHHHWNGVALLVKDCSKAVEPGGYLMNKIRELTEWYLPRTLTLFALLVAAITLFLTDSWITTVLAAIHAFGAYFSYQTILEECSGSCSKVTQSAASKLLGLYSLSTIGFSYSITHFLLLLLSPALFPVLIALNLAAIPFPIWSIAYQAFVTKAWCKYCLAIQLLLVAAFALSLNQWAWSDFSWFSFLQVIALMGALFYGTHQFQQLYLASKKYPHSIFEQLHDLFKDAVVKERLLQKNGAIDATHASSLLFLNPTAPNELLIYISPFCTYCKELFEKIEQWKAKGALDDYRIILVLQDDADSRFLSGCVIGNYLHKSPDEAWLLLKQWFATANKKRLTNLYRKEYASDSTVATELALQKSWVERHNLSSTPVVLLNGYLQDYSIFSQYAEFILLNK